MARTEPHRTATEHRTARLVVAGAHLPRQLGRLAHTAGRRPRPEEREPHDLARSRDGPVVRTSAGREADRPGPSRLGERAQGSSPTPRGPAPVRRAPARRQGHRRDRRASPRSVEAGAAPPRREAVRPDRPAPAGPDRSSGPARAEVRPCLQSTSAASGRVLRTIGLALHGRRLSGTVISRVAAREPGRRRRRRAPRWR